VSEYADQDAHAEDADHVQVTFRFVGDAIEPSDVSAKLGLPPTFAHAKGDREPKRVDEVFPTGVWGLRSPLDETADLEAHLSWLLDALDAKRDVLGNIKAATGCRLDFYCSYFCADASCGFDLSPHTLSRIAAIDADFGVSFWAPADAWGAQPAQ
jgi:Domain of unknown function (DUF4279)